MKAYSLLSYIFIVAFLITACDSSNSSSNHEECVGIDFSEISCIAEFLSADGLRLGCDECLSDLRSVEFGIEFSPLLVSPDEVPEGVGTQFGIDGVEGTFAPEFVNCNTLNLFEIVQNQSGENVKGNMVGTLDNIEAVLPDELSLFINIPGVNVENTFCGFCWSPVRPPCADNN